MNDNKTPKRATTNADRIRAMGDEELAQTLNIAVCPPPVFLPFTSCNEGQGCMKCWMNWLQQPAPEEGEQS